MSTEKNDEFAESIRPAVKGKSDKYSWRLYQRAKKNGRERVYLMAWNGLIGYQAPDPSCLEQGFVPASKIALGQVQDGFFHGGRLQTICTPGESLMDWAYSPAHHVAEWIDITDWFWSNYLRHGRCLFHRRPSLDRYEPQHQKVRALREARASIGRHPPRNQASGGMGMTILVQQLRAEIEQLKAENAALRSVGEQAWMALVGYLPAHQSEVTKAAIDRCMAVLGTKAKEQQP